MQSKPINRTIAITCSALVIGIALTALIGWLTGNYLLVSYTNSTTFPSMKVNTAICVLLIAAALIFSQHKKSTWFHWSVGISFGLALIALFEHLTNTIMGVDELFISDPWTAHNPGLMSLATAVTILLGNFVLLAFVHGDNNDKLNSTLLFLFTINPLIAVSAYLYGADALFNVEAFATLSLPTTAAFCLLVFAFFLCAPGNGRAALWHRTDFSAKGFRVLSISLVIFNFSVGIAISFAQSRGVILAGFGFALFSVSTLLVLTFALGTYAEKVKMWQARFTEQQSETKKLETALIETLEISTEGILLVDQTGTIVHANSGCETIFHWDKKDLLGKPIEALMPQHFRKKHQQSLRLFMASPQHSRNHQVRGNIIALTQDGIEKPVSVTLSKHNVDTCNHYVAAVIRDVIPTRPSQSESQTALTHAPTNHALLKTDPLTGCLTRDAFEQYVLKAEQYHQRFEDKNFGVVLLLEIDFMSIFLRKYDRDGADLILANFANAIQRNLRSDDKVFRYTDSRFLLISPTIDADEATLVAERVRTGTKITPTYINNENVYFTCSIVIQSTYIPADQHALRASVELAEKKLSENLKVGRDQLITL